MPFARDLSRDPRPAPPSSPAHGRVASDERSRLMRRVAAAGEPIALIGALEICAR
jgi:hypothetical protein